MANGKLTSKQITDFVDKFQAMTVESLNNQLMTNGSAIRQADGTYDMAEVVRYMHINYMIQYELNQRVISFMRRIDSEKSAQNLFWKCESIQEVFKALESTGFEDKKVLVEAELRIKEIQFAGRTFAQ